MLDGLIIPKRSTSSTPSKNSLKENVSCANIYRDYDFKMKMNGLKEKFKKTINTPLTNRTFSIERSPVSGEQDKSG